MSLFTNALRANNGDIILPKTRSEWVYRANSNDLESDLTSVTDILKSGLLISCTHSKTGTTHTLTGIPENMKDHYTAKFKATGDFTDGDNFNINGTSYLVKAFNNSEVGTNGFKNGSIVECDISPVDSTVFLRAKSPNIPPYNPLDPPQFTYTGTYQTVIEPDGAGWYIQFTSSGIFTLHNPETLTIDVCVIGGGGGGGCDCGGGGSGYMVNQYSFTITNTPVNISIGLGGKGCKVIPSATTLENYGHGYAGGLSTFDTISVAKTSGGGGSGGYGHGHAGGGWFNDSGVGMPGGSGITGSDGGGSAKYPNMSATGDKMPGDIFGNGSKYGYAGGGGGGGSNVAPISGPFLAGGAGGGPDGGAGGTPQTSYDKRGGTGKPGRYGSTGGEGSIYNPYSAFKDAGGSGGGGGGSYGGGGGAGAMGETTSAGTSAPLILPHGSGGNGAPGVVFIRNSRSTT